MKDVEYKDSGAESKEEEGKKRRNRDAASGASGQCRTRSGREQGGTSGIPRATSTHQAIGQVPFKYCDCMVIDAPILEGISLHSLVVSPNADNSESIPELQALLFLLIFLFSLLPLPTGSPLP